MMKTETIRVQVMMSPSCKEILQITAYRMGENMSEFYRNAAIERILRLAVDDPKLRDKILLVESQSEETDRCLHAIKVLKDSVIELNIRNRD